MAVETRDAEALTGEGVQLRRSLKLWQVIGLSVGLMAPSMAISINPQGAIGPVGRAIPLSFVISMVGALFVAYGFARLSQHFNHSGSVLGLVGATLGPRAGTVAGWCLVGTYTLFALLTAVTAGIYGTIFLDNVGITNSEPNWAVYVIAAVVLAVAGGLAAVPTDKATDVILSFEGVTMLLIVIAAVVVLIKLFGHSGPGHLHFTMSVFTPAKGTSVNNVFLGVVFGFLSFAGFEAAAALGGESSNPRRDIPIAIIATVTIIGLFYVVISAIEVMGFGTSAGGLKDFSQSPALLGTLGQTYVADWFGDIIIGGTVISAFGCCMASTVGASRIIYSFARDGVERKNPVANLSSRYGTPAVAVGLVIAVCFVLELILALAAKDNAPLTVFEWTGTTGTYMVLIAYALVSIGAFAYLFVGPLAGHRPTRAPMFEVILPLAGVATVVYTIFRNVHPWPEGSAQWLPIAAGGWAVIGLAMIVLAPSASKRLGRTFAAEAVDGPS